MKNKSVIVLIATCMLLSCAKKEKFTEPSLVIQKWAKAVKELNYTLYTACEAYPKSEQVFRDMYREYYFEDMMAVSVEEPDMKKTKKDYEGNSYIFSTVSFEGSVVKRSTGKSHQIVRGDAVFIKFAGGKRSSEGWLMSNRTFITINR